MYDGTTIENKTDHTLLIQPYRADGLTVHTFSPEIAPGEIRLINNDHNGDADFFLIVAFMKGASVPGRVGVTQGSSGHAASGSVGISIDGFGLTVGGGSGETHTQSFSSSMAAAVVLMTKNNERSRYEANERLEVTEQNLEIKVKGTDSVAGDPQKATVRIWVFKAKGPRVEADETAQNLQTLGW